MIRTRYVLEGDPYDTWDLWIGPGPCPKTGRRFGATRYRNHFHDRAVHERRQELLASADLDFLAELTTPAAIGKLTQLDAIRANLVGLRLGTSRERHGYVLARLADGTPVREIRRGLAELDPETLDLFPRVLS